MDKLILGVAATIVIAISLYFLYINGYMVTSMKAAVLYVGSLRGNSARFALCSGFTRRVLRFRESKSYSFHFAAELTKGEVCAEILDCQKQVMARLSSAAPTANIDASRDERYYLVIRYKSASGSYTLEWE